MDKQEEFDKRAEATGRWWNSRVPHGDPRWSAWVSLPVNITHDREELGAYCFDTYLSWPAWSRCGLHEEAYRQRYDLCECFAESLKSGPPGPVVKFQFRNNSNGWAVDLEAAYGPNGRGDASVYITTPGEPKWVKPRIELGRIKLLPSAREYLCPEYVNAALGRHAAGDWGQADTAENDRRLAGRMAVESWYDLPTPGDVLRAGVVTDPSRSETTVCASLSYS